MEDVSFSPETLQTAGQANIEKADVQKTATPDNSGIISQMSHLKLRPSSSFSFTYILPGLSNTSRQVQKRAGTSAGEGIHSHYLANSLAPLLKTLGCR